MSAGDQMGHAYEHHHDEIVEDAIADAAEPQEHEYEVPPAGAEAVPRLRLVRGFASRRHPKGKVKPAPASMHAVFRTEVAVCGLAVKGVLPSPVPAQGGAIAIGGNVQRLSCDQALELVDALLLVVTRMDVVAEERCGATTDTTCDRED
jgi:hypothetical protein